MKKLVKSLVAKLTGKGREAPAPRTYPVLVSNNPAPVQSSAEPAISRFKNEW